jgi:hypothetical protein
MGLPEELNQPQKYAADSTMKCLMVEGDIENALWRTVARSFSQSSIKLVFNRLDRGGRVNAQVAFLG